MKPTFAGLVLVIVLIGHSFAQTSSGRGSIYNDGMARGVDASARSYFPQSNSAHFPGGVQEGGSGSARNPASRRLLYPLINGCAPLTAGARYLVVALDGDRCPKPVVEPDPDPESVADLSATDLAWIAADRAMSVAEWPELRVAPSRIGLTGLPTFFWLERTPRPVTASAQVPGLMVTALAEPVEFTWDFGEGEPRTTSHSGRGWTKRRDGNIAHTYERRGTRTIGVDVLWHARWRVNGGAWQHLGYFSNNDSRRYRVRQMVAMLTRTRRR